MNEPSVKRLLIASVVAIALMWLLALAGAYIPGASAGAYGYMDPVNWLTTAIAMCAGGYIGGKRFIAVAVLLMIVMWIATIVVVLQMGKSAGSTTLASVVAFNRSQILFSMLAATAGASIGAWLRMKRTSSQAS